MTDQIPEHRLAPVSHADLAALEARVKELEAEIATLKAAPKQYANVRVSPIPTRQVEAWVKGDRPPRRGEAFCWPSGGIVIAEGDHNSGCSTRVLERKTMTIIDEEAKP